MVRESGASWVTSADCGSFAVSLMGADRNQGGWGVWSHKLLITKTTMALAWTVASRGYAATTEHLVLRAYSLLGSKGGKNQQTQFDKTLFFTNSSRL